MSKFLKWEEVKIDLLSDPEVKEAYEQEIKKEKLQLLLTEWRSIKGFTRAQVAEKMGITAPAVTRLESNIINASLKTILRYAKACGIDNPSIHF